MSETDLKATIERYNEAWNAHDLDAIMAMHAPDMVFDNHTAGETAEGAAVRGHIGSIFETWPEPVSSCSGIWPPGPISTRL